MRDWPGATVIRIRSPGDTRDTGEIANIATKTVKIVGLKNNMYVRFKVYIIVHQIKYNTIPSPDSPCFRTYRCLESHTQCLGF